MATVKHEIRLWLITEDGNIDLFPYADSFTLSIDEESFTDAIKINFVDNEFYETLLNNKANGKELLWFRKKSYFEDSTSAYFEEYKFLIEEVSGKDEFTGGTFDVWGRTKLARLDTPYALTLIDRTEEDQEQGLVPYVWQSINGCFAHDAFQEVVDLVNAQWQGQFISAIKIKYDSTALENFFKREFFIYPGTFTVSNSSPYQVISNLCDVLAVKIRNSFDAPDTTSDPDEYGDLYIKKINANTSNLGRDWHLVNNEFNAALYDYDFIRSISFQQELKPGYNNLLVIGPEESGTELEHSIDIEMECGATNIEFNKNGFIKVYVGPLLDVRIDSMQTAFSKRFNYCLSTEEGLAKGYHEFVLLSLLLEEKEETISIQDGVCSTNYPIYSITSYEYEGKDLGAITHTQGYKNIQTTEIECGMIKINYITQYMRFRYLYRPTDDELIECKSVILVISEIEL